MNKAIAVLGLTALLATSGCSGLSRQEQQALTGGAIGTAGGAVAGALIGGSVVTGALVGGAAGAAIGALKDELDE